MLLLWDIDGTLLVCKGAGIKAMGDAGAELFGPGFDPHRVEYAGRLDPIIIHEMLLSNNIPATRENTAAMRAGYAKYLQVRLKTPGQGEILGGVRQVVGTLRARPGVTMGLLTGNFAETGSIKLRTVGLDPEWFPLAVWGDHSPHTPPAREHLPAVGMSRYRERFGRAIEPDRVVVIGDTPHDVHCAKVHGCRSLGVATGKFSVSDLRDAGASHVVSDLTDTDAVVSWLVNPSIDNGSR